MNNQIFSILSKVCLFFIQKNDKTINLKPLVILGLLFASLFISPFTMAKQVTATAEVSKTNLVTGEEFTLKIRSNGTAGRSALEMANLKAFTVHGNQYSSSLRSINGKVTTSSTWILKLSTQQVGKVVIPSFNVSGAQTKPITLQVKLFGASPQSKASKANQESLKPFLDFQAKVDKSIVYKGEDNILTTQLIVKTDPNNIGYINFTDPTADGAVLTQISDLRQYEKVLNGSKVIILETKYSIQAGKLSNYTVGSARLTTTLLIPGKGEQQIALQTAPIKVTVKEKPDSYHGVWLPSESVLLQQSWIDSDGKLIDPSADKIETKIGEPVTRLLKLIVQGVRQENIPLLKIDYPDSIRVYDDKPVYSKASSNITTMVLKQVIIPKQNGEIALPEVKVPWWNSKTDKNEMAQVKGMTLTVTADKNAVTQVEPPTPTPPTTTVPADTKDKVTNDDHQNVDSTPITKQQSASNMWPYLIGLIIILTILGLLMFIKQKRSQPNHVEDSKFIIAIKSKDGVKIQTAYHQWQRRHPNITEYIKQDIENELDKLMACLYSSHKQDYNSDRLTELIDKAEQEQAQEKPNPRDLLAKL